MSAVNKMFPERKCALCGKLFIPAPEHAYRDRHKGIMFCSWHCFNHRNDNKPGRKVRGVEKCTLSGEVIETYESAKIASERNDAEPWYIRSSCKKGTAYRGCLWRYKNDLP